MSNNYLISKPFYVDAHVCASKTSGHSAKIQLSVAHNAHNKTKNKKNIERKIENECMNEAHTVNIMVLVYFALVFNPNSLSFTVLPIFLSHTPLLFLSSLLRFFLNFFLFPTHDCNSLFILLVEQRLWCRVLLFFLFFFFFFFTQLFSLLDSKTLNGNKI